MNPWKLFRAYLAREHYIRMCQAVGASPVQYRAAAALFDYDYPRAWTFVALVFCGALDAEPG